MMLLNSLRQALIGTLFISSTAEGRSIPSARDHCKGAPISPVDPRVEVAGPGANYMRTTVLEDGTLLGGYAAPDGDDIVLRAVTSDDDGATWTLQGTVGSANARTRDFGNSFPLQLPGGRILYAFRNHDRPEGPDGPYTFYRIVVSYSEDGGASWEFLSHIDEREVDGTNGVWEPYLRVTQNGTIQAFYSAENNGEDQDNVYRTSTDGGQTWSDERPVSGLELDNARDGMVGLADVDDNGNMMCVFETTENGSFEIYYVLSSDDGFTWDPETRTKLYTAGGDAAAGAPQVINVGGTLVVSLMSTEEGGESENPNAVDGGQMRVVTSGDGGETWSEPTVVSDVGSHWPGLHALDGTSFLALYSVTDEGLFTRRWALD